MNPDAAVTQLARQQHGVVTNQQARDAGLTRHQILQRRHSERWVTLHRGVYAIAGAPRTFEQEITAACLVTRGVGSHRSGLYLWSFRCDERVAEVTVPHGRTTFHDGVVTHQSLSLIHI